MHSLRTLYRYRFYTYVPTYVARAVLSTYIPSFTGGFIAYGYDIPYVCMRESDARCTYIIYI